jgi:tight adherence protein C
VLREIRVGKPRKEALRELSERVKVDDITSLVSAVIQADQLGVGISNILRIQAEQVRTKRRQQAEEEAMKAPIKMLFPLVFFIFPTLFVVLLGPAIIQIAETLLGF